MPSCRAGLYTIKPTIGLVSPDGMVGLTKAMDTAGPMAKSTRDVADLLDILVDREKTDFPKGGYKSKLTRSWSNIRVGVVEPGPWRLKEANMKTVKEIDDQLVP